MAGVIGTGGTVDEFSGCDRRSGMGGAALRRDSYLNDILLVDSL